MEEVNIKKYKSIDGLMFDSEVEWENYEGMNCLNFLKEKILFDFNFTIYLMKKI